MKKNLPRIVIGALVLVIGLTLNNIYRNSTFRLTKSTPALNGVLSTSTGTIKLEFNRKIDGSINYADGLDGSTEIISSISVEENSLVVKLKPLTKDKKYSFTIREIKSLDGEHINKLPVNFTARYIPYDQLSSAQKNLELSETDKDNQEDPVLAIVPHQGDQFYLTSEHTATEDGEPILVLNAQLFLYRSELESGRAAAIEKGKNKVREYLRSRDLDPEKYLIRYEITEPPATAN
jgi:hypothetical protein